MTLFILLKVLLRQIWPSDMANSLVLDGFSQRYRSSSFLLRYCLVTIFHSQGDKHRDRLMRISMRGLLRIASRWSDSELMRNRDRTRSTRRYIYSRLVGYRVQIIHVTLDLTLTGFLICTNNITIGLSHRCVVCQLFFYDRLFDTHAIISD